MTTRHQIAKGFALEYAKATKREKGILLDNLCAATGWSRANARRRVTTEFAKITGKAPVPIPKRRHRTYQPATITLLTRIWTLAGEPCGKYLAVIIADELERLERFNELETYADLLTDQVREQLLGMSAATMDRYLKPVRDARYPASCLSSTKPGAMLRSEIPVRWSGTPMEQAPGFFEVDTVAHCGHSLKGEFLYSITLTDVFTGWTANCAVKNRAHRNVVAGIEALVQCLPYPMTGLDFDNGGEFINVQLIEWAEAQHIDLTRARAYQHNDNAHVEQRNRDWVRRHAFRYRYEGPEELALLNELWELVGWRKNHLLPMVKANGYGTARSGRSKRTYDAPRTAYQRLLDLGAMDEAHAQALAVVHRELNPAQITRRINQLQGQLITRAKLRARADGVDFREHFR